MITEILKVFIAIVAILPMNVFAQSGNPTPSDFRAFSKCAHDVRIDKCLSRIRPSCGVTRQCNRTQRESEEKELKNIRQACRLPNRFSGVVSDNDKNAYMRGIEKFQAGKLRKALEEFESIGSSSIPAKAAFWASYIHGLDNEYRNSLMYESHARPSVDILGKTKGEQLDKI